MTLPAICISSRDTAGTEQTEQKLRGRERERESQPDKGGGERVAPGLLKSGATEVEEESRPL